jgi:hypothetical protein
MVGMTFVSNAFGVRNDPVIQSAGKADVQTGWRNYIQFAALICSGPVDVLHEVWYDDVQMWTGPIVRGSENMVPLTIGASTFRFYWGTETQGIDSRPTGADITDGVATGTGRGFSTATSTPFTAAMVNCTMTIDGRGDYLIKTFTDSSHVVLNKVVLPAGTGLIFRISTQAAKIIDSVSQSGVDGLSDGAGLITTVTGQFTNQHIGQKILIGWGSVQAEYYIHAVNSLESITLTLIPGGYPTLPPATGIGLLNVGWVVTLDKENAFYPSLYLDDLSKEWYTQTPKEYHPAYRGICYIVAESHYLGENSNQVQNMRFVVSRWPGGAGKIATGPDGHEEISVAAVVADALTNPRYGLGMDSSVYDADELEVVTETLTTETLGISPLIDRAQPFDQFLIELLGYVDGYYYAKPTGKITLGLNRGVECSGVVDNAVIIDEPCLTELPNLEAGGIGTTRNEVRVQFRNALLAYHDDLCAGHSAGSLQMVGAPAASTLDRQWVTRIGLADVMARATAKHLALSGLKGTLKLRKSMLQGLKLGDPFYFQYRNYFIDPSFKLRCRVTEINVTAPFAPEVDIAFERDLGYLNAEAYVATADYQAPGTTSAIPRDPAHALLIELPPTAAVFSNQPNAPRFTALVSRRDALTSASVFSWESAANVYTQLPINIRQSFPPRCQLMADLTDIATSATVHVISTYETIENPEDIPMFVLGVTDPNLFDWVLIFDGSDEIIAVDAAVLQSNGDYLLTIRRGALDTVAQAISAATVNVCYLTRVAMLTGCSMPLLTPGPAPWDTDASTPPITTVKVKVQSVIGQAVSPLASALIIFALYRQRTARPWKPTAIFSEWPTVWHAGTGTLDFHWRETCRAVKYSLGDGGPVWLLDMRVSETAYHAADPGPGDAWYRVGNTPLLDTPDADKSITVNCATLAAALGGRVTFTARLYARDLDTGLVSLWYDERDVTFS